MEQFYCKTKIISGSGIMDTLAQLGSKRMFLVTDPFFVKNGTANKVIVAAGAVQSEVFDKVKPDPSVELVAEGTAALKAFSPDTVVALGGGSAMDCAKAMMYFSGSSVKMVAIPTTSGSGSEVTDFSILTHSDVKHPLVDKRLVPDVAILDSDLLEELPPALIADTGFDVLSHAAEAYVATGAGVISDALAADAFGAAFEHLPASFAGQKHVRLRIHIAATMAAMAFSQAGLGICHAMAHSLGGMFHVPHGRLNAILLPAVINFNAKADQKKYADLARRAGLGGGADTVAVRNLKNGLLRLRKDLALPATLQQAGVDPQRLKGCMDAVIRGAVNDPCCDSNPVKVDAYALRRILEEVAGRG